VTVLVTRSYICLCVDRGGAGGERGYGGDSRQVVSKDSHGSWHGSQHGSQGDDRGRKPFPSNQGFIGNNRGGNNQWSSGASQSVASNQQSQQRPNERWGSGAGAGPAHSRAPPAHNNRPGMAPQRPAMMAKPLMQSTPASQTFLASAANIMMGVGLAANRPQEQRFDAYSNMPANVRRY